MILLDSDELTNVDRPLRTRGDNPSASVVKTITPMTAPHTRRWSLDPNAWEPAAGSTPRVRDR